LTGLIKNNESERMCTEIITAYFQKPLRNIPGEAGKESHKMFETGIYEIKNALL
jgi:hypothetical protein